MSFTTIPKPEGTRQPCRTCNEPTVLVTTGSGTERVHCGTYTTRCHTPTTRRR